MKQTKERKLGYVKLGNVWINLDMCSYIIVNSKKREVRCHFHNITRKFTYEKKSNLIHLERFLEKS